MATYQGIILARSPYYITATGSAVINSAQLSVYIWSGLQSAKPATANYVIVKKPNTSTSTNIIFDISPLIRDYFEHKLTSPTDALWVETELVVDQSTLPNPATVNNIYLALDGYGYFSEGVNYSTINYINTLNILDGATITLPILANSDGIDEIEWIANGTTHTTTDLSTEVSSTDSDDKVQYVSNATATDTIKLYNSSVLQETIVVNYVEECKFTPRKIKFYDKNGMLREFYMFKLSRTSLNVNKENYNNIIGDIVSNNYTYNVTKHQYKDYNITAKETITLNSGFIGEEQNELFRQLFLSEFVWIDDKPATVTSNTLDYKTSLNDKLINYTINFEYSNNTVNNVY